MNAKQWYQRRYMGREELRKKLIPLTQMAHHRFLLFFFIFVSSVAKISESAKSMTIANNCTETLWPVITPDKNFHSSRFVLKPGESAVYNPPAGWSGRIWGRTRCNFDRNGNGTCKTGSCYTSSCKEPSTLAEFTFGALDFYDVSLVDGFNLPILVAAVRGKGNCSSAGCDADLRQTCPPELAVKSHGHVVACRSACDVFDTDEYCCRGKYGNPTTCVATNYSMRFKEACPAAYTYAYDDPSSIKTCSGADYIVTFCPTRNQTGCSYRHHKLVCN